MIAKSARKSESSLFPAAAALALLTLLGSAARAQDSDVAATFNPGESRSTNALEIAIGLGSAQGFGTVVRGGPSLGDLGVGADLAIGWRINPRWMVGVYSASGLYPSSASDTTWTFGTSAGVQANYHFGTQRSPWIGLGTGWHGYWLAKDGGTTAYQGLDLVRLQLGLDVPVTPTLTV